MDIVPMRIFDILACGGFVLAEHSQEIGQVFEIGESIVTYRNLEELLSKADYYLRHPQEAQEIAERGRKAILRDHTIAGRVGHMLDGVRQSRFEGASIGE